MTDRRGIREGHRTVTPYLIVRDASATLSFLERAFGAEFVARHEDGEGRVMHAEARIGDSRVMLGEANDRWPPTRSMVHLYVGDADAVYRAALQAGARALREPEDTDFGDRSGGVEDADGTQWWIATHLG
jgi:PhnB protein